MAKFWTKENIKEGFEIFRVKHGRLPIVSEIDGLKYLPSSRHIQKKFGGLEKLRNELGYKDNHFGKGKFRSEIASRVGNRGRKIELALEKILKEKFGEIFVHTEKIFDNSKNRIDFFIYSPDGNFGIDIFYTETMRSLQSNINIKMNKYNNFLLPLFLVVANNKFKQDDLEKYTISKNKPISQNTKIITLENMLNYIKSKKSYPNPLINQSK